MAHSGEVQTSTSFDEAWNRLKQDGPAHLYTSARTAFRAEASVARDGRQVIRFFSNKGVEHARAYRCCWGYYYNCNRTRIGMYVTALFKEQA